MQPKKPHEEATLGPNRRELLQAASVGGALLAASATGCAPGGGRQEGAVPGPAEANEVGPFELEEVTLAQLQAGMDEGRWTAQSITELYLQRIEALDRQGPELRSVIETNPEALDIARQLDAERTASGPRGPLHGVPILLKDNIATADRMTTTAGSLALAGSIPAADSFVARRLREAGAVLLGKANLSEWANFRSDSSSSGWSGRGGQCRNPYALDRNPCGSSSGSGAAASGNLVAAAIGTETNGSVVCPSSACGLVGIKPTLGLVSRTRIIPIAHSQDTAGPMARTVADAAAVLGALTGVDPEDSATAASQDYAQADYTQALQPDGLRGARIGVGRDYFGFHPAVDGLMEDAIQALRDGGAEIIDPVEIAGGSEMGQSSFQVLLYEFKADLNAYLATLGPAAPVKS
ncbi:MAG: amidase family protein, partial [Acidobacteriota bacterium]